MLPIWAALHRVALLHDENIKLPLCLESPGLGDSAEWLICQCYKQKAGKEISLMFSQPLNEAIYLSNPCQGLLSTLGNVNNLEWSANLNNCTTCLNS